jgi:hypothetical protein
MSGEASEVLEFVIVVSIAASSETQVFLLLGQLENRLRPSRSGYKVIIVKKSADQPSHKQCVSLTASKSSFIESVLVTTTNSSRRHCIAIS